jgi:N-acyl-D-aspartate/D-glutamate deacylase
MTGHDLVIRGGTVVDGTGRPGARADVGVDGGRVSYLGADAGSGGSVIDAEGLVVCPGFIDVHTHYDAQVMWDPAVSPSPLHGVTTVIGGNCGISLAPLGDDGVAFVTGLLSRVEAIPLEALAQGLHVSWRTFAQYLDAVERQPLAVNIGFLAGHSAIRRFVMGSEGSERAATADEIRAMASELAEAIGAGALGFSSATVTTHKDGDGNPTPPCAARAEELVALAGVCRSFSGTSVEFIPGSSGYGFTDDDYRLIADMSVAAQRQVNWNTVLLNYPAIPDIHERQLRSADRGEERGGCVVPMIIPHNFRVRTDLLQSDVGFRSVPGFDWLFGLSPAQRRVALADPAARARLRQALVEAPVGTAAMFRDSLAEHVVSDSARSSVQALVGRSIADLAAERHVEPFDVMADLAVESDLDVGFVRYLVPVGTPEERARRAAVLRDPRVVLGASDGGAHVRGVINVEYTTASFAELVRGEPVFALEELVRELTSVAADLYGLVDRGRIRAGAHADLVVFDPETIAPSPVRLAADLPGGASRLLSHGVGIQAVVVAGRTVVAGGVVTGDHPGRVLRSGRDSAAAGFPVLRADRP